MKLMKTRAIAFFMICVVFLVVAQAQQPHVELARGLSNATSDAALNANTAVVVTIPTANEFYIGDLRTPKNELGRRISESLKGRSEAARFVYIAAGRAVDFGTVVEVLNIIRQEDIDHFRLIVDRGRAREISHGTFLIVVPSLRDPGEDVSKLKPNPLTLVVSVSMELELKVNQDSGPRRGQLCFSSAPHGFASDPDKLQNFLGCLFAHRTKLHAYKVGMETRTDVPAEHRIEKTTFVKASRAIKFGDVLRVIDSIKGAGADPIGLQIDDLPN